MLWNHRGPGALIYILAIESGNSDLMSLPSNPSQWKAEVERRVPESIREQGIYALDTTASKITLQEFLSLRVLWRKGNSKLLTDGSILPANALAAAETYLKTLAPWSKYIGHLQSGQRGDQRPSQDIGAFSFVDYYQTQVLRARRDNDGPETPKVYFTPIAARVRARARHRAAQKQDTPTKSLGSSDPFTDITGYSFTESTDDCLTKITGVQSAKTPGDDLLSKNFEALKLENEQTKGIEAIQTPEASPSTADPTEPLHVSPLSPLMGVATPAACDEQIVNTALVLLLNSVTMFHPGISADWTMHRRIFHLSDVMEARTDGYLRHEIRDAPLAILEVKAAQRVGSKVKRIRMQEGAQMAAWIGDQPEKGQVPLKSKKGKYW